MREVIKAVRSVHSQKRRARAGTAGLFLAILVFAGLIAIVMPEANLNPQDPKSSAFSLGQTAQTSQIQDADAQEYEDFLRPAVMFDPEPFADAHSASPEFLLQTAIWRLLSLNTKPDAYAADDKGRLMIPTAVVEDSLTELFGGGFSVGHTDITLHGTTFLFDPDDRCYHIPVAGETAVYLPRVESVQKSGDIVTLKVAYISSGSQWGTDFKGNPIPPAPDKYMNITLREKENHLYLSAIQPAPSS